MGGYLHVHSDNQPIVTSSPSSNNASFIKNYLLYIWMPMGQKKLSVFIQDGYIKESILSLSQMFILTIVPRPLKKNFISGRFMSLSDPRSDPE